MPLLLHLPHTRHPGGWRRVRHLRLPDPDPSGHLRPLPQVQPKGSHPMKHYADDIARAGTFDPESATRALHEQIGLVPRWGCGPAGVYARIIDAHYAQAEKADQARAGRRGTEFYPTRPADQRRTAARARTARIDRDTMTPSAQQTEENR